MIPTTVRKDGSWWVIERDGKFIKRARTKKLASLTGILLDGDPSVAVEWYRLTVAEARRTHHNEADVFRSAIYSAKVLGLSPDHVRADPDTGKPID